MDPRSEILEGHARSVRLPAVRFERLLDAERARVIDLRSPGEYAEDHLPGAVNLPLFDDLERVVVGTLYKQASPAEAFEEGLRLLRGGILELVGSIARVAGWSLDPAAVAARMEALVAGGQRTLEGRLALQELDRLPPDSVVLNCWRGGLRSQSVAALLRELGLPAYVLWGGYRDYRRWVSRELAQLAWPRAFVLRGLTGVGKTLVLREFERLAPGATVDLEGLAQHRSSVLGMVGLQPVSQKAFDSALVARQRAGFSRPWMVVEGESRKVGDVTQPVALWTALEAGVALEISAPVEVRVKHLIEDYLENPAVRPQLAQQLEFIEQRLGSKKYAGQLVALLQNQREAELVRLLLEAYYDPLYRHSEAKHGYAASFDSSDPARCAAEVLAWIERQPS